MRKILLIGEVNDDMYKHLSKKLDKAYNEDPASPVVIELVSQGGYPEAAIAMCGRLRNCGMPVRIEAYGQVYSAASLILAAGDERLMSSEATVMVHESSSKTQGNVTQLRNHLQLMNVEEKKWAKLLELHTGTPALVWMQLSEKESYLTPEECLSFGLIDGILKGALRG